MNDIIPNIQKRIIGKQRVLYQRDASALRQKREAWEGFKQRSHDVFEKLIHEFKEEAFFGNLFIEPEGSTLTETKNQNTVCVRFGPRPTGIIKIEYNLDGSMKSGRSNIEEGALLFSQSPNGRVACIIFGSKSDLLKPKYEYFIYKFYDSPSSISTWQIWKAVNAFFWYARITSHINGLSIWNTFKLDFYNEFGGHHTQLLLFRIRPPESSGDSVSNWALSARGSASDTHFNRDLSTLSRIVHNVEKKFDKSKDHGALLKKYQTAILGE